MILFFLLYIYIYILVSRTTIARVKTSPSILTGLLEMCAEFKTMVGNELLRQEYVNYQKERRKELLGKSDCDDVIFIYQLLSKLNLS